MKLHIKKIEKKIGKKIDIVWSFDLGDYYPFKYFSNNPFKLYNPIDEPLNKDGINSAKGCQIIISITKEILEKYHQFNVPKYFIHHGLADEFVNPISTATKNSDKIIVGLSGNWLRPDLDTVCLLKIIQENKNIQFEFFGTYESKNNNLGGNSDDEASSFIGTLKSCENVILQGPIHPKQLAIEFQRMNAFLICYDILKDQCHGTNYHKVMEYLSTGKVIISNNITTYSSIPNLIEMTASRTDNNQLPSLFKTVIDNLQHYNQAQFIAARKAFAVNNSYSKKIGEIEKKLNF